MLLVDANVVVIARQFNPTVTNPVWLVKHGLVREDEIGEGCAFTNVFSQVVTEEMIFVLTPDQLQFTPRGEPERKQELAIAKVGEFVKLIPHTPFIAAGLNFNYQLFPENIGVQELCRSLFFVQDSQLHAIFDTEDARFGGYLSKDVLGCRLKLDVKPAYVQASNEPEASHFIQFHFNYHMELLKEQAPVEKITSMLSKWNEASRLCETISDVILKRDKK